MDKIKNFSVNQIVSKNEKRRSNKLSIQNIFLEKCIKKIETYNTFGKEDVVFEVPQFIIGIPPYNQLEIVQNIRDFLDKAGFCTYSIPNSFGIYISWKKNDIEKIENKKKGYLSISLKDTGFFDNLPINPNNAK